MAQRAFTQRLSKQHASDVRKNVATHHILPKSDITSTCTTAVLELVEPLIDYEEFVQQHAAVVNRDPLRDILEFPANDLTIRSSPKRIRTVEHVMPKEELCTLPLYVQQCVHCFSRPWKVVEFSHRKYSISCCQRYKESITATSPTEQQQEYECDDYSSADDTLIYRSDSGTISSRQSLASLSSVSTGTDTLTPRGSWTSFDLRSSNHDPQLPGLLDRLPMETIDQRNEMIRSEFRQSAIFHLYGDNADDPEDFVERRMTMEIPYEHIGNKIMVKCMELRLDLEIEPLFASMAIYDAKERKKLSENFYFDMNSENLKRMLTTHIPYEDASTKSHGAIFEVTHPSHELYLVVRLEKVLQGDINESVEPYLKEDKDKYRDKARSNAADFCERLGKFRMPFAWTGISLTSVFNEDHQQQQHPHASSSSDIKEDTIREHSMSGGGAYSSNSLERKSSTSSFDQLKRKATEVGGFTRRGSLERRDKRRSWSPDEFTKTIINFKPKTIQLPPFLRQESDKMKDEDLYKLLPELKRPANLAKRFKIIPGSIKLDIRPAPEEVSYALTPELARLEPYPGENQQRPIKEILEFPVCPILMPHYAYRNLLFVNFKELNFSARTGSSRNLAVRVQLMGGEKQSDALEAVFAKSSCPEFSTEAFTCINYHNKCPSFYDEVKIALPANLMANHHLLFTVFHISCQKKTQDVQTTIETPVGYTWLPILQDGRLSVGDFDLPVMIEEPPENYSFIPANVQLPGTKWLDNHRPVFSVSIDAVTSVHTLSPYLNNFATLCEYMETRKVPPRIGEGNMEREIRKALSEIHLADSEPLIKHLPVIMDKLLELMVTTYKVGAETLTLEATVFVTLCQISHKLAMVEELYPEACGRVPILSKYVQYQAFIPHPSSGTGGGGGSAARTPTSDHPGGGESTPWDGQTRLLHEQLAYQWVSSQSEPVANLAMSNSWLLFELMVKSMIEHLERLNLIGGPRKGRFSHQLTHDLVTLVEIIARKVIGLHNSDSLKAAQNLNSSLAFFIFDLLSIMDRGYVFGLIKTYYSALKPVIATTPDLIHYKLDFLRIVCSHEHFVALNLPYGTPYTTVAAPCSPSASVNSNNSQHSGMATSDNAMYAELSQEFRQQHFLIGLVLSELATVLEIQNTTLHGKAIRCIRNLMTWHDSDIRFQKDAKARVATLYLPLLSIVMDTIPQFHQFMGDGSNFGLLEDYQGPHVSLGNPTINPEVAYAISGSRMYAFNADPMKNKSPLGSANTRHLLACFVWVLKNLENAVLSRWMVGMPPHRLHKLLQVLNAALPCFEYKGKQRSMMRRTATATSSGSNSFRKGATPDIEKLEEVIRGTVSARNDLINRRRDKNSTDKFRWRKDQMPYRSQFYDGPSKCGGPGGGSGNSTSGQGGNDHDSDLIYSIEGNLATEISMVLLDTLELIVQVATTSEMHHNLLGPTLKVLLHALSRNQSTLALQNLFSSQRSLILKFHNLLFDEESDNCADLCLLLLKHCGSQLSAVRSQAAASLYLLMRQNFEIGNNFARVKMQVTMSLSSLVGTSSTFSEQSLRKALKTILVYAESDTELQGSTFPEQVRDLLFNLHMILSDTVKMKEYQEDPEMLLDLMHRIAKGYQNSPDLRLTWLENMAKKHIERPNQTEAAMCFVHSAALVAEYLSMLESQTHLPVGAVSFKHISPNCLMESAVSDDVLNPGEDGICLGTRFTETGLKALLEEAANAFQIAGMYEAMNDVYKVMIPICETNREFQKLAKIHGKLQEAFNRIGQLHGKRMFGTYFRVGFYGSKFGDLDKQEFVYKEPTLTKLPEIFNRLQNFYVDRFGPNSVEIIKDSNNVEVNKLDEDKAYIQITYVEPYFETYELRSRETHFERNFNINRFIFATPFTKTGKAHGELHEQWKRKTILTTANHFPYVKTRIQVVDRQQVVLEPIEVAIEDIQKKTNELAAATNQEPPDTKILQMVLQGCIGTTVNQGPLEMATVFLKALSEGAVPTRNQNKLRLCFKDFSHKCHNALKKNKNLIGHDQRDYQKELESNYKRFVKELEPLIQITAEQIRGMANSKANASHAMGGSGLGGKYSSLRW